MLRSRSCQVNALKEKKEKRKSDNGIDHLKRTVLTIFHGCIMSKKVILSLICYVCAHQNKQGNLSTAKNKEFTFIKGGYSNWKMLLPAFKSTRSPIVTFWHVSTKLAL